jgi:HEAT repeat protein
MIVERDRAIRVAVLWAIHDVDFREPFIVPKALGANLEDESADVRGAAAVALGHAGLGIDPYVPALLRHAAHDADSRVRELCAITLQHMGATRMVTRAVLPTLLEALDNSDATIRSLANQMMHGLGPAAAPLYLP